MNIFTNDFNVIYIRVMQGCNLNCTHCFTLGNDDPRQITDLSLIDSYLKSLKLNVAPKKATFYIHGGETFLAPLSHLKEVNKLIHKYYSDIRIDIIPQTNLTFKIDDEFIKFIHDEYNSTIGVSWDADIRFDDNRQELLFFKNLKLLLANDIKVHIAITAQRHLLKRDPIETVNMFNGVDSIDFELLTTFDDKSNDLKPNNIEWSNWFTEIVKYYHKEDVTWALPQIDLFVKSIIDGAITDCKCNCCDKRTFTLNPNGTVGFCPDTSYMYSQTTVDEMATNWEAVESKAVDIIINKMYDSESNSMCYECEHYDICGGNCESTLFDDTDECPLSKKALSYMMDNIDAFKELYNNKAKKKLTELRDNYEYT